MVTGGTVHQQELSALENDRMRQAAELLLAARREVRPIENLPEGLRPHTIERLMRCRTLLPLRWGHSEDGK